MHAASFFDDRVPPRPPPREWAVATAKRLPGAALLVFAAVGIPAHPPHTRAWIGLRGLAWLLFFGLFHGARLGLRLVGIWAEPIFRDLAMNVAFVSSCGGSAPEPPPSSSSGRASSSNGAGLPSSTPAPLRRTYGCVIAGLGSVLLFPPPFLDGVMIPQVGG